MELYRATPRDNKPDINESRGDRWDDAVCEDTIDFKEAKTLFSCSFGNPKAHLLAGFDSWLNTTTISSKGRPLDIGTAKRYSTAISSHYFGLAFREMIGWSYGALSDCLSIREVEQLIKILEVKGL